VSARNIKALTAALVALAAGAAPATPQFEVNPAGLRKAQYMEALMFGRGEIGGAFQLTDQRGVRRALEDFRGRLVLLYFGYTYCPDICPTDLLALKSALERHGDAVQVLFVTLDPERDTAEHLRAYLGHFDPRMVGLTGTPQELRSIADRYKVYYGKVRFNAWGPYFIDHSGGTFLIDREGRYRGNFPAGASAELITRVLEDFL